MGAAKGTYTYKYPRPSVTTDCVIFANDPQEGLSVLLVQRGGDPFKGYWALPGGFLDMEETAEEGALRELREETGFGVEIDLLEQLGCFSDVDRDPRGRTISIAFYALVQKGTVTAGDDAAAARWFPVDGIPPLAFDHAKILQAALERLGEKIQSTK